MLQFYLDIKCPASYLALGPTLGLLKRYEIKIDWKPFRSRQETILEPLADESKAYRHRRVRGLQRRATHLKYAQIQGLPMQFRAKSGDSDAALAALSCDLSNPIAFLQKAFAAYWEAGVDINDAKLIRDMLLASDNKSAAERLADAIAGFDAYQSATEEAGIFWTPTYFIDGQLFIGREHLPWIEKLITQALG